MVKSFENNLGMEIPITQSCVFSQASESHPKVNEDNFFRDDISKTYGVFDGVGGNEGGAEASKFVSDIVNQYAQQCPQEISNDLEKTKKYFFKILTHAKERLLLERWKPSKFPDMDTTASVVKILDTYEGKKALIFNVGDTRVYSFRNNRYPPLILHTLDDGILKHKYGNTSNAIKAQEYFDSLEQMPSKPVAADLFKKRNLITNSIGTLNDVGISVVDVKRGDILILTTDGIHDPLTRKEISDTISINQRNLNLLPYILVNKAGAVDNDREKFDDRTVIVVRVE